MSKIFISYSRVDDDFTHLLAARLRRVYGHDNIWFDDELHGRGGANWWELILDAIGEADIFVYLLSNESVQSAYCQAEFAEAQRLNKRIITVQVRDRTKIPPELSAIQYVDMAKGIDDAESYNYLIASLTSIMRQPIAKQPKWEGRTPKPQHLEEAPKVERDDVTTPTLELVIPPKAKAKRINKSLWFGLVALLILITIAVLAFVFAPKEPKGQDDPVAATLTGIAAEASQAAATTNAFETSVAVAILATRRAEERLTPTATRTASPTPTSTATSTAIPQDLILFAEDFEARTVRGITPLGGTWRIEQDDTGNYFYLGGNENQASYFSFGAESWTNYGIELRMMPLDYSGPSWDEFEICLRCGNDMALGYDLKISLEGYFWERSHSIFLGGSTGNLLRMNSWNTIRLEVVDNSISLSINNQAQSDVFDDVLSRGNVYIRVTEGLSIGVDDIIVWEIE